AAALSTGLTHAVDIVPMLFRCDWTLLRARGGGFITSDRSYAIHDPTLQFPWESPGFFSSDYSETTMPLSNGACLLMRPMSLDGGLSVHDASGNDVEAINFEPDPDDDSLADEHRRKGWPPQ